MIRKSKIKNTTTANPQSGQTITSKLIAFIGDPKHTRKRRQGFVTLLILIAAADLLVAREHGVVFGEASFWDVFFWKELPGGNAVMGLLFGLLLIGVAKFVGLRCGLMKRDDYYDD